VLYGIVPASLQDVDEPDDVAVDISIRMGQAVTHSCLSGQVADPVEFLQPEQVIQIVPVLQLKFYEPVGRINAAFDNPAGLNVILFNAGKA
jgi:hypothetical protein